MSGERVPSDPGRFPTTRPRRNRREPWSRRLVAETRLSVDDLIWPVFVHEAERPAPVSSMPGVERQSIAGLVDAAARARDLGIPALAVFPVTPAERKSPDGEEAANPDNLVCRAVRAVARAVPDIGIVCDVALDPYTTHGQDGLVRDGYVVNDETLEALVAQALVQAEAGCHVVAPSDMMDGRVGRDPRRSRRRGLPGGAHHGLLGEVRLGVLRAVPRRRRLERRSRPGRQADLPDGSRQRRRGAARGRARHRGGRGHGDGQARPALSRHRPPREGALRPAHLRLSGERRVRDAAGRGGERLARRRAGDDGKPRRPSSGPAPTAC